MIILSKVDRHPGLGGQKAATFKSAPFGAFGVHCETTQTDFDLFTKRYSAAANELGYQPTDFVAETVVADFSKRQK